ncbi:formyltetrahydrofolate deformylase [Desulfovibrio sp. X2]|uniref:formyltetrahydrofolate deformylase n=1 Tax=Desulfovibrio sp. X2 TaxID=941449 RepID=UPI0003586F95|nr:formyltetrahydrofolate deformylase [Desulfovibrio sp. X2]EPR37444.1 formyltetrahydrofolate deformylase [Desulfovibrio sp. X2]
MDASTIARLRVTCPDRPGIIAAITSFLYSHNVNITALDQHATKALGGTLYLRLEFQTPHLDVARPALEQAFGNVLGTPYDMDWEIDYAADVKRVAVFVSGSDHCLMELLWRFARGDLPGQVAMVVSNHPDHRESVERFGIPYHYVPVTKETKAEAEARMVELCADADLIVLARYMQILSPDFVSRFENRIINIHHSFLPAFMGADPYRQAYERGVKIIGATAHYVTEDLDCGPIIEQDVIRVGHRHSVEALGKVGRDLERQVLARAVTWHLEDRVIVSGNKTIVF